MQFDRKMPVQGTGRRRAAFPPARWMGAGIAAGGLLLTACGHLSAPGDLDVSRGLAAVFSRPVTLHVRPVIRSGGFQTAALVSPFTVLDITELVIKVHEAANPGLPIAQATVPTQAIGSIVKFGNLAPNTSFRIACAARDASGSIISDDASSSVIVDVGQDDQLAPVVLLVRLKDKAFSASGEIDSVDVFEGTLVPVGTVSVSTRSASPQS